MRFGSQRWGKHSNGGTQRDRLIVQTLFAPVRSRGRCDFSLTCLTTSGLLEPMEVKLQYFPYECPHCHGTRNAAEVAKELEYAVLATEMARRKGRRQTPHAGPGRPAIVRCPGCDAEMSSAELREHRSDCVRDRLKSLSGYTIHLCPKDPDPFRDFKIQNVSADEVVFCKLSSTQRLPIELRKVAEITPDKARNIATIRVLGRVAWDGTKWLLVPARPGGAAE